MNEVMEGEGYSRPILLLSNFTILILEVGCLLVLIMNQDSL